MVGCVCLDSDTGLGFSSFWGMIMMPEETPDKLVKDKELAEASPSNEELLTLAEYEQNQPPDSW